MDCDYCCYSAPIFSAPLPRYISSLLVSAYQISRYWFHLHFINILRFCSSNKIATVHTFCLATLQHGFILCTRLVRASRFHHPAHSGRPQSVRTHLQGRPRRCLHMPCDRMLLLQEHIRASDGLRNAFRKGNGVSNSIGILLLFIYPVWTGVLRILQALLPPCSRLLSRRPAPLPFVSCANVSSMVIVVLCYRDGM